MSAEIKLFLAGEVSCNDCFKSITVKVGASCDSRNTVVVEPWHIELPKGWTNLQFSGPEEWDEGYACPDCTDIRAVKHEANEVAKEELIAEDKAKEKAEKKLSKKELKEAEKAVKKLAKKEAKKTAKLAKKASKKEGKITWLGKKAAMKALKEEKSAKKVKSTTYHAK
jgi:hypothetical protein